MSKSLDLLPLSITSYKPEILKIKIESFRFWIERRLTEILEGLEDEILWSLVFNYLEDAYKRAKREGSTANPSGGLSATEILTALTGFLGHQKSRDFVIQLFTLLREAEESPGGIPPEFAAKEAESEAYGIIENKRKEMEISQRVGREVRRNEHYNDKEHKRRHDDYGRHDRERYEADRNERGRERERFSDHGRDRYRDNYDRHRHSDLDRSDKNKSYHHRPRDTRIYSRNSSKERDYSQRDSRSSYRYRENEKEHEDDHYSRRREGRHEYPDKYEYDSRRRHEKDHKNDESNRTAIPSSSSEDSPSPCWEASIEAANAAPRAPTVQEYIPTELEKALRAKALKSQKRG